MHPDIGAVLDELTQFIRHRIILTQEQADACALFCAMTHATDAFDYVPYLAITSGTKQSGKTNLRKILSWFSARPWIISGTPSDAALFTKIEQSRPTIFIDECDRIFAGKHNDALYALINSGNRRDETIPRVEMDGNTRTVKDFSVFCAKTLTGIGKDWPDTIVDRCINVRLRRKLPHEKVPRLRDRVVKPDAEPLRLALEQWATPEVIGELSASWPELPEELSDRGQDGWEPLLAVADLAGWGDRARHAARALIEPIDLSDSREMQLLEATKVVMYRRGLPEAIFTADLIKELRHLPESEWRDLDPTHLAHLLRPFDVRPTPVRIAGHQNRGYKLQILSDAWERYLGPPSENPVTPVTPVTTQPVESSSGTPVTPRGDTWDTCHCGDGGTGEPCERCDGNRPWHAHSVTGSDF